MPTTALDSLTLSGIEPLPSDPAALQQVLDGMIDDLSAAMTVEMRRLALMAAEDFIPGITASAPGQWSEFVDETVGPMMATIYRGAALSATIAAAPPPHVAALMAPVINQSAVDYTRVATNRIVGAGNTLWGQVRGELTKTIATGGTTEDLKGTVQKVTGYSEFRADTIARTEVMGAYNHGDNDAATSLGEYGPIEKQWLAAIDARTRESHIEANGQTVGFTDDFIVGGNAMPYPGAGPPEEVINCRCVVLHLYPGDKREDGSTVGDEPEFRPLDLDKPYDPMAPRRGMGDTLRANPADFGPDDTAYRHLNADGSWTAERQAFHDGVVRDYLDHLPRQAHPDYMMMGGGGGAGKTTAIRAGTIEMREGAAVLNADDLKDLFPETAAAKLRGDISWAANAHEESSYLVKRIRAAAIERNQHVVMDATGSHGGRTIAQIQEARQAGYSTRASYVSIPPETGVARAVKRAEDMAARGEVGRFIDPEIVRAAHHGANDAFQQVAEAADSAVLIDNTGTPTLVARYTQGRREILDEGWWAEFLTRGAPP